MGKGQEEGTIQALSNEDRRYLDTHFVHHPPKSGQLEKHQALRDAARQFAGLILEICPDSPEKTHALTWVQQAMMNGNAAISIHGGESEAGILHPRISDTAASAQSIMKSLHAFGTAANRREELIQGNCKEK